MLAASRVVNVPSWATLCPICTPSIVPPFMSAVVTVPRSAMVRPALVQFCPMELMLSAFMPDILLASSTMTPLFCISLPVVPSNRVRALSVADPGPTTSPAPALVQLKTPLPSVDKTWPALPSSTGRVRIKLVATSGADSSVVVKLSPASASCRITRPA